MGEPGGDDDSSMGQPDSGMTAPARMCSTSDPSLRLCIDFNDSADLPTDGSSFAHPVMAQNLTPMTRTGGDQAVQVDASSRLHVPETTDLDIVDNLTVSMWIKFDIGGLPLTNTNARWLYDNNTQYFASLRVAGVIRCGSGPEVADSEPVPADGKWHHVACTYEREEIRVHVDGNVEGCEDLDNRPLPTGGDQGLAIGANIGGGAGGVTFSEQFIGGIDNVQVFARTFAPQDVCDAAGDVPCRTTCPDS